MSKYNIEINQITFGPDFMVVDWIANIGWGQLTIQSTKKGFNIDTECLGTEFLVECLEAVKKYLLKNSTMC